MPRAVFVLFYRYCGGRQLILVRNGCVTQNPSVHNTFFVPLRVVGCCPRKLGQLAKRNLYQASGINHYAAIGFGLVFRRVHHYKRCGLCCSRLSAISRSCVCSTRQAIGGVAGGPSGGSGSHLLHFDWRRFLRIGFPRVLSLKYVVFFVVDYARFNVLACESFRQ